MMRIGADQGNSHSFQTYPMVNLPRNAFDLSHGYKTAFDSGYLIPFFAELAYPGDTFNVRANCFARLSTPVVPFMDNVYLDTFWFACPVRLVWDNFRKFCGEQNTVGASISFTIPRTQSPASGFTVGSLYDYFGIPTVGQIGGGNQHYVNNLFPRMYNLVWNQWFRDQNMQDSVTVDTGDGPDTYTNYVPLRRGKRFDYFTSATTAPQKGTAVSLPLGTSATVKASSSRLLTGAQEAVVVADVTGGALPAAAFVLAADGTSMYRSTSGAGSAGDRSYFTNLYADLASATAATINDFRYALQIQALLEKDSLNGSRYSEIVRSHFGVVHPDQSWRPELLGTNSTPVKINPVAQSSSTTGSLPLGLLGAFGVVGTSPYGFVKSFTEHTLVMGLVSVRAELTYQQGLERKWTDQTRYDLYWPVLANLGQQTVYRKEIYCTGATANDDVVFGYQERYAHLRYKPSLITGKLRSTASGTLDVWHLSQKFTSAPTLGDTFIKETPPLDRVQAVSTEPQFLFDAWVDFKAARPLPLYGTPANFTRF